MRLRDIALTFAAFGLAVCGTLAVLAPSEVDAIGEKAPTMKVRGVELSLVDTTTDEKPTARVTVCNTTERPRRVRAHIALYSDAPGGEMARMAQPPIEHWSKDHLFVLAANETQEIELVTNKKIPRRNDARFVLRARDRALAANVHRPRVNKDTAVAMNAAPVVLSQKQSSFAGAPPTEEEGKKKKKKTPPPKKKGGKKGPSTELRTGPGELAQADYSVAGAPPPTEEQPSKKKKKKPLPKKKGGKKGPGELARADQTLNGGPTADQPKKKKKRKKGGKRAPPQIAQASF